MCFHSISQCLHIFHRNDGSAGQSEGQHSNNEACKEPQQAGHSSKTHSNTDSSGTNQGLVFMFALVSHLWNSIG